MALNDFSTPIGGIEPPGVLPVRSHVRGAGHDHRFYSPDRAFGRFGIRIFEPVTMEKPHWHGHIEANLPLGFEMTYDVDGSRIVVPPDRLVVFWAGVPHQLTAIRPVDDRLPRLCNIYLPLDRFLMMTHIAPLQVALLGRGMVVLPEALCREEQARRWYADYRTGRFDRIEVTMMELNALFRRVSLDPPVYLRPPQHEINGDRALTSAHIRHVIAMVRHILENLEKPLRNADIAAVTGLHENYALTLFTRVMQVSLKQFVIRMRLVRSRALLVESSLAIATIAEASGFPSLSQFYAHFKAGYGLTPAEVRARYIKAEPR